MCAILAAGAVITKDVMPYRLLLGVLQKRLEKDLR
jgi:acetyltransferase-like isoleucine patch superfamily enzyme